MVDTVEGGSSSSAKRKRASRKGLTRRFDCPVADCDKKYSRAEHLARHELNHAPKQVYQCEVDGCGHSFVRLDLFSRHTKKHEEGTRSSVSQGSPAPAPGPGTVDGRAVHNSLVQGSPSTFFSSTPIPYQRLEVESNTNTSSGRVGSGMPPLPTPQSSTTTAQTDGTVYDAIVPTWPPQQVSVSASLYMDPTQSNDNFAAWLFDSPNSQQQTFDLTNLPFVDFGMGYSPNEAWDWDHSVHLEPTGSVGYYSPSQVAHEHVLQELLTVDCHTRISKVRREELLTIFGAWMTKKRPLTAEDDSTGEGILSTSDGRSFPQISSQVLEECVATYWRCIAKQLPILHQPTFECETSSLLVLFAMIALGATQLVRLGVKGSLRDYRSFADIIAINLRWEIFTDDDAVPPIKLWVAQALLLLELYEKMYTTRRLHERAHIHHASTLTLLRRGSPLIGQSGSDTPPSAMPTRCSTPVEGVQSLTKRPRESESMRWWRRWAQNESMHRVVFAAFQMDALHAVLFGHDSSLFPYEIRLTLPCDDALWEAHTPDEVQRLEATFSMHGIQQIPFLDGLKMTLHGQDVQSHCHARLILVAGLFSIAWHIHRREKHLQFLETSPGTLEQERWKNLLLGAYGNWRCSFEAALSSSKNRRTSIKSVNDDFADPTVLFHLAHITMHADIIDLQVFAGSHGQRLLGRKVSDRDRASAALRMKTWVGTATAQVAVLHSFKLLHETLSPPEGTQSDFAPSRPTLITYSCRADPSIYRPWVLYLAALTIWTYQFASMLKSMSNLRKASMLPSEDVEARALHYLRACATTHHPDGLCMLASAEGCTAVLQVLSSNFENAEHELMEEAGRRLIECAKWVAGGSI